MLLVNGLLFWIQKAVQGKRHRTAPSPLNLNLNNETKEAERKRIWRKKVKEKGSPAADVNKKTVKKKKK